MNTRRTVAVALFAAFAIAVNMAEGMLPMPLPGLKLGAANVFALSALVLFGVREAFAVAMVRIAISWLLTGNVFALLCGGSGGIFSVAVMSLMYVKFRDCFSIPWISVAGAWAFNLAQVSVAAALAGEVRVFWYLVPLLPAGTAAGFAVGLLASLLCARLERIMKQGGWRV
jgi:heptaprenyl diphosphate synthase